MEIIQLAGYTLDEKIEIAKTHLVKEAIEKCGLANKKVAIDKPIIEELISGYTRESGVRDLERQIQKLCSKYARQLVEKHEDVVFTKNNLPDFLGPRKVPFEILSKKHKVGVTNGLAWTPYGGEVLQVEAIIVPGNGKLILTGQLGDVMKESAQAALSYAKSHANQFHIDKTKFNEHDLHIHLPAGGIPKDGPSAGIIGFDRTPDQ
jgi:ATP-dependent Lon protease